MLTTKIYWNMKGHTKRMCPAEDILESRYWPEENYNSGTELMIWINPVLVGRRWFEADIDVSHRSRAERGKRHTIINNKLEVVPAIIPVDEIYGHVGEKDEYTLNMTGFNRPFKDLSSDIVKKCIDGFAIGRQKFMEIFRNENVGCT